MPNLFTYPCCVCIDEVLSIFGYFSLFQYYKFDIFRSWCMEMEQNMKSVTDFAQSINGRYSSILNYNHGHESNRYSH